jgi:hypothetical protein
MCAEKFDLQPSKQCTTEHTGHFGELYREVYQDKSGLIARQSTWTAWQHSEVDRYEWDQSATNNPSGAGPFNKTYLDMDFNNDVYSLGQDKKNLTKNGEPVETGSPLYVATIAEINAAERNIDFNAPPCAGAHGGLWEDLNTKQR